MVLLLLLAASVLLCLSSTTDTNQIQRLYALNDLVAVARNDFIGVYRHNGTSIDASSPLQEIPLSGNSTRVLCLKLASQFTLTYCDAEACWVCSLKANRSHSCQNYLISNDSRQMASAECYLTNTYLTIRFIDTLGNASIVKFEIAAEEAKNTTLLLPMHRADDMEGDIVRNQALLGSFRVGGFTYFLTSADRINVASCLVSGDPSSCMDYKKSVRLQRVCDDDETELLESKTEVGLTCDSSLHERLVWDTALAAYYRERAKVLTVVFGLSSPNIAYFCKFELKNILWVFDMTWNACQNVTTDSRQKCRRSDKLNECYITSKNTKGEYSMCQRYVNSSTTVDVCALKQYEPQKQRHFWLENFGTLLGSIYLRMNMGKDELVTMIDHTESRSYFVLRKGPNGDARVQRLKNDGLGVFGNLSYVQVLWNATDVDPVPMVYDLASNAIFFSKNNFVQVQPVTCNALYKTCAQIPPRKVDPLKCVWCQEIETSGFSRPRNTIDPELSCPDSKLFQDSCPKEDVPVSGVPVAKIAIGIASFAAVVLIVAALAIFLWKRKKNNSNERVIDDIPNDTGDGNHSASPPYEVIGRSYLEHYRALFENSDIRINREDLVMESTSIGAGWYGQVYRGICNKDGIRTVVACKTIGDFEGTGTADFLREAKAMSVLDHPRVLQFIGICFDRERQDLPNILVTKYMQNGDLSQYLRDERNVVTLRQLLVFGLEVAQGMEYIHSKGIIHRDLAARNCMLDDDHHICIADLGLSRFINESEEGYQIRTCRPLPVSILSIEALERGHFSMKSDVWAFGNLLWEVMTRGYPPWEDVTQEDLLRRLRRGERLPMQETWPPSIYTQVMYPCWSRSPENRPTFTEIYARLHLEITDPRVRSPAQMDSGYEVPIGRTSPRS
uniref:receptor protein-tyrosine kinase n=1 Tax=Steinernema glaseri TaxID=37863 RepID=A0A1I8AJ52_9BILA